MILSWISFYFLGLVWYPYYPVGLAPSIACSIFGLAQSEEEENDANDHIPESDNPNLDWNIDNGLFAGQDFEILKAE